MILLGKNQFIYEFTLLTRGRQYSSCAFLTELLEIFVK